MVSSTVLWHYRNMARDDPQVNFRMPAELKERLEEAARAAGRSVTQEMIQRLQATFSPQRDLFAREELVRIVNDAIDERIQKGAAKKSKR